MRLVGEVGSFRIGLGIAIQAAKEFLSVDCSDGVPWIVATSADMSLRIRAKGEVVYPGRVAVPSGRFRSAITELGDGEVTIWDLSKDKVAIESATTKYELNTRHASELLPFPTAAAAEVQFHVPARQLRQAIVLTSSINDDTFGSATLYVRDGSVVLVSTDGRRLAKCDLQLGSPLQPTNFFGCGLTPAVCKALHNLLDVDGQVGVSALSDGFISVIGESFELAAQASVAKAPRKWEAVYSQAKGSDGAAVFTIPAGVIRTAVKQALIACDTETRRLGFVSRGDGYLRIDASSVDLSNKNLFAAVSVPIQQGIEFHVYLDGQFVLDFLSRLAADTSVQLAVKSDDKPVVLTEVVTQADYIVMPMKV